MIFLVMTPEKRDLPFGTAYLTRRDQLVNGAHVIIGDRLIVIPNIGPRGDYFIFQDSNKMKVKSLWPLRMAVSQSIPAMVTNTGCSFEDIDDSEQTEVLEIYKAFSSKAA
jgi:hypothetical protein